MQPHIYSRLLFILLLNLAHAVKTFAGGGGCLQNAYFGEATLTGTNEVLSISTCSYAGEYSEVYNAVTGAEYRLVMSDIGSGTWITVRINTFDGSIVAEGPSPLEFTSTYSGTLYVHWSLNDNCDIDEFCHVTTIQCKSCPPPNTAPYFVDGSDNNLQVCENSTYNSIDDLLSEYDPDYNQLIVWSVTTGPDHGTLSGFIHVNNSNPGLMYPAGLYYAPNSNYSGQDEFVINVSDGIESDDITIHVTVLDSPSPTISGNNFFCPGGSTTLDAGPDYANYEWSPLGETTQTISVSVSGDYSVTVTDNNGCTGSGSITVSVVTGIDDSDACTDDACDSETGVVSHTTVNMDDGDACTEDGCTTAGGVFHYPVSVDDDGNICTDDYCDSSTGVHHDPLSYITFDDNDACTVDPGCFEGSYYPPDPLYLSDNNPCTADACNTLTGIYHTNITGPGIDENLCLENEVCEDGVLISFTFVSVDDGIPCTADICDPSIGVYHEPLENDYNNCTADFCNTATGEVTHVDLHEEDFNPCTVDGCDFDLGFTHEPVNTDDGDACTVDGCDTVTGTFHNPVETDDDNLCTLDGCDSSTGVFNDPINVDDGNLCTLDACNTDGNPTHTPLTGPTDDGNPCSIGESCNNGVFVSGTITNPDDGNICTDDGCDGSGGTFHWPFTGLADDGNACSVGEYCNNGAYIPGFIWIVDDFNICTADGCDPITGNYFNPLTHPIDDGNACTTGEGCDNGILFSGTPVNVDDGNFCSIDACDSNTGVYHTFTPESPVDDGNPCTVGEFCEDGDFHPGTIINSDDGDICTIDGCDSNGGVYHTPLTGPVDDANACTIGEACDNGTFIPGTPLNVDDGDNCTVDGCDIVTGEYHDPLTNGGPFFPGGFYDDGNICTGEGVCIFGFDLGAIPVEVGDGNVCTIDGCDTSTGVFHDAFSGATTDDNPCTINETCDNGNLVSTDPISVDDNNPCTEDGCDTFTGIYHNFIAEDGNICTDDFCDTSTGIATHVVLHEEDFNSCTTDGCNSDTGFTHDPVNADDGDACTVDGCDSVTGPYHDPVDKDDNNVCTLDGCDSSTGIFHDAIDVDDGNPCTTDGCNSVTGPTHDPVDADDHNACTIDGCNTLTGQLTHTTINPDDNNICTIDYCNTNTGVFNDMINLGPVDDGNACTTGEFCKSGLFIPGTPTNTNDGNTCTTDVCNTLTGVVTNIVYLDDNNPCTHDICNNQILGVEHLYNISDGDECTNDFCNTLTGPYHIIRPEINDGNPCTLDACDDERGTIFHFPVSTEDGNPCTLDGCNTDTGIYHNLYVEDDNNICTIDNCNSNSGHTHLPVNTDDINFCTDDACNTITGITHEPIAEIDDHNVCTNDYCDTYYGWVDHFPIAASYDDNNQCTSDGCNSVTGIYHNIISTEDNNACTLDGCNSTTGEYHNPVNTADDDKCTTDGCHSITGIYHDPVITTDYDVCTIDACNTLNGDITHTKSLSATATSTPATCSSNNGTATAYPVGGTVSYQYLWRPPSIGGQTTKTATNLAGGSYTVTVTDANGCTATASTVVTSSGGGVSAPVFTGGPTMVCKGDKGIVYCVAPIPGSTIIWTLPPGATKTGSGPCVTIKFSSSYKGGNLCAKATSSCGTSSSTCLAISVVSSKPATPGSISGPSQLCPGSSAVYSISPVALATGYVWSTSGGLIITSGQGTTAIVVSAPSGFTSGSVKVLAKNCKGDSGKKEKSVSGKPAQPGSISGPGSVCKSQTKAYSIGSVANAISYNWSITGGAQIFSGQGTKNITVKFTTATSSTAVLSVVAVNGCGNSTPKTKTISVNRFCMTTNESLDQPGNKFAVTMFPNPVSNKGTIAFTVNEDVKMKLRLSDLLGRVVLFDRVNAVKGLNQVEMEFGNLPRGFYLLTVEGETLKSETLRIVVD